jgi:hypothetical protein
VRPLASIVDPLDERLPNTNHHIKAVWLTLVSYLCMAILLRTEKGIEEYLTLLSIARHAKYTCLDFLDFLRSGLHLPSQIVTHVGSADSSICCTSASDSVR